MALPNNPQTRKEMYLSNMAGQGTALPSEPHTREEEYLDYIAKNGGGGGTGDGDMKKSVYDGDLAVAGAGGIKSYVTGAISGKVDKVQGKGLSTNDYDDSAKAIVDNVTTDLDAKQPKTLSEPIYVDGVAKFSVETAIDAVNGLAASNKSALLTKADTSQIAAIQDGQNIDSFSDVETALAGKMPNYGIGTGLYVDSDTNQLRADAVTLAIKDSPKLITSGAVFSGLSPKYGTADQDETDLDGQDKFPFYDNSASAKRHTTFGNIKAKLKEYFDSLYVAAVAGKGLSTNDYDNTAKGIVDNIQSNVIANTKLIKDTVGWSGKNKFFNENAQLIPLSDQVGETTFQAMSGVNANTALIAKIEPNTNYIASHEGGNRFRLALSNEYPVASGTCYMVYNSTNAKSYTFNSGNYKYALLHCNNTAISLDVAKAMLRDADILDDTYEPYFGSTAFPRSEQAVLGAKNLAPIIAKNVTNKGITLTFNEDDSVVVSGTATEAVGFEISSRGQWLKNGERYKLSGCKGGAADKYKLDIAYTDTGFLAINYDQDEVEFIANNARNYVMRIVVYAGQTMNNVVIKPMVRLATDTDPTYAPHAMTNRELTDEVMTEALSIEVAEGLTLSGDTKVLKKGDLVYINFNIQSIDLVADTTTLIFTIETKGRPSTYTCWGVMIDVTDGSIIRGSVGTDGKFQLRSKTAKTAHNILGSMVYMLK